MRSSRRTQAGKDLQGQAPSQKTSTVPCAISQGQPARRQRSGYPAAICRRAQSDVVGKEIVSTCYSVDGSPAAYALCPNRHVHDHQHPSGWQTAL
jgi:hypothetical protein